MASTSRQEVFLLLSAAQPIDLAKVHTVMGSTVMGSDLPFLGEIQDLTQYW